MSALYPQAETLTPRLVLEDWTRLVRHRRGIMSEANKALVRRWLAEMDKRNLHIVDELVAVDYIDHNPPIPDLAPGREGVKQANALLLTALPDATHTIEDQISE